MPITVGSKYVRCSWNDAPIAWQTVEEWFENDEVGEPCGYYADRYEDFLNQIDLFSKDIKAICGLGYRDGIFIKFAKKPPKGYVHEVEFAAAYARADELDYVAPNVLRVWWD
jgi:hypothetical protein